MLKNKNKKKRTYTSAFESAGIGNIDSIPVPALFKSAGIGPGAF